MTPLVEAAADALLPYLDRPFCLFGHSMGALVAFAFARHLRARYGVAPAKLFVSSYCAPHMTMESSLRFDLPDAEFLDALAHLAGTPEEIFASPELLELMLPVVRADCEVCATFECREEPPFAFPISAYGGLGDPETPREALEAWQLHTRASFDVEMFPGDHFYLRTERARLLRALSRGLQPLVGSP
jgi:medium-chain acyl-[acyl-carrier-protein] hydrolase